MALREGIGINELGSRKFGYGSALHVAVREGHERVALFLIDKGADVNVRDSNEFTPLHNAAWNGNLEMIEMLLDAGADLSASNYAGDTALSLAQKNDRIEIYQFLIEKLFATVSIDEDIDLSGRYRAEIIHKNEQEIHRQPKWFFGRGSDIEVSLIHKGDRIIGSLAGDRKGDLEGTIVGNKITFEWHMTSGTGGSIRFGEGIWVLGNNPGELHGTWNIGAEHGMWYRTSGIWNLRKIE